MEARQQTALAHYALPSKNAGAFAEQLLANFGRALEQVSSAAVGDSAGRKKVAAAVAIA